MVYNDNNRLLIALSQNDVKELHGFTEKLRGFSVNDSSVYAVDLKGVFYEWELPINQTHVFNACLKPAKELNLNFWFNNLTIKYHP